MKNYLKSDKVNDKLNNFWNTCKSYYDVMGSTEDFKKEIFYKEMQKLLGIKDSVIEIGCGDATKLRAFDNGKRKLCGIDLSRIAIQKARDKIKRGKFKISNIEKLPYKDNSFDFVYSAYVFEHLNNPEKVLSEMIRISKKYVCVLCPNFGSPLYKSPPNKDGIITNALRKFLRYFLYTFKKPIHINWLKVQPILNKPYEPDFDATCEPDILNLRYYLISKGLKEVKVSSGWEHPLSSRPTLLNMIRAPFKMLGRMRIYPFSYMGPFCFVIFEKTKVS